MMPFPGGLSESANGTLLLSVAAAILYLFMVSGRPTWRRTAVKTAAIGLLAVLALHLGGPVLLVAALGLCALGDAFLAQDGDRSFLAGLASFLIAHLLYVGLFYTRSDEIGMGGFVAMGATVAATLVLGFVLARRAGPLVVPVAFYVAAIGAMGASAVLAGGWVLAGALMFMVSDAILGIEKFLLCKESKWRVYTAPAVWILYYCGQMAITVGFLG